jgi:hypothetical protein
MPHPKAYCLRPAGTNEGFTDRKVFLCVQVDRSCDVQFLYSDRWSFSPGSQEFPNVLHVPLLIENAGSDRKASCMHV